jgi:hypothetical protein
MIQQTSLPITEDRSRFHTFLLCCGMIGAAAFSIVNFTFAAVSPNYDIASQSVGDLELASYGWVQSANFVVVGLFIVAFAWGLRKELVSGRGAALLPVLHVALGLVMMALGIFIFDPVHSLLSIALFILILTIFFLFIWRFAGDARWAGWPVYTAISAVMMIALLVIYIWARRHHGAYAGLFERAILLTRIVWTLFFTVRLIAGARLGPVEDQ